MNLKTSFLKNIGPGFLLAGAAIGVSHLVQATRAGADYGFSLIWILLLACISKYPFLEFGPRFTAATGKHLIDGYRSLGKAYYIAYLVITIGTMFVIQASVTMVTAGLAEQLFGMGWSPFIWSVIILGICILLLVIGKYSALDKSMKIIVSLLTILTLVAVLLALQPETIEKATSLKPQSIYNLGGLAFVIAFMGWMPIPLDASVWHSIWTKEKAKGDKNNLSTKGSFIDFNIGYLSACFIGLLFLLLGALIMFESENEFSTNAVVFATQLIDLYKSVLGNWSYLLVSVAAFITMFSTTLTVTDAYPRVFAEVRKEKRTSNGISKTYLVFLILVPLFSLLILFFSDKNFTYLVDFASGLSFLSAPFLAYFNYKLVNTKIPEKIRPQNNYRLFSKLCLFILIVFAIGYILLNIIG